MIEDQLHSAMHQQTGDIQASSDILHRAQMKAMARRQRRDNVRVGVGASALSILVVIGVMAFHGSSTGGNANNNANVAAGPQTVQLTAKLEAAVAPATPPAASDSRPAVLVGAATSGRLVVIDSKTGKTNRLLTTVDAGTLGALSLSADNKTVYFDVKTDGACSSEIRSIPVAGGAASKVVDGSVPSVSPDGTSLAYVTNPTCGVPSVVVQNLKTDKKLTVASAAGVGATSIRSISWSPDGSKLALDLRFPSDADNRVALITASKANDLTSAQTLPVPAADKVGTVYEWPAFTDNDHVFVSERCCTSIGSGNSESSRMVVADLTGKVTYVVASGYLTKDHTDMVSSSSGSHMLYLSGQDLMVSDNADTPVPLAHGLVSATWH